MSLINDMLRDLSDKQAIKKQDETLILADTQTPSWEQEKIANFFQQSRFPLIFISLIVFVVIFIFSKLVLTHYRPSDSIAPEIKPLSVVSSAELIVPTVINNDVLMDQSIVSPAVMDHQNAINSSDLQTQIYQLIDQASRAMTLDRLTSPENDNAYFYYQELLKLDAQNPVAIAGVNKITDRYLQMAEKSIKKNDFTKAGFFLDKAGMVTPNDIRIADFRNHLSIIEGQDSVSVSDPFEPDSRLRGNDEFLSNNEALSNNETPSNDKALLNDERMTTGNASLTITPNPEFLDEQRVKQARDWVAQGLKSKAIELLENHIQLYAAPASEQYLLDLYYSDKNLTAMQTLLNSNLKISTLDQTYYRARAAILQGDNQSAITLLESHLSEAAANENYRALLAGLYQREQLYAQATSAYRNLLQSFNPKPAYWLGLALSFDAQNQASAAIHAYKKILDFEQLEPQVIEYAQDRIVQLSRDH
jgi:MSHA biogenesis protein MshN